jgi:hypothetical protein
MKRVVDEVKKLAKGSSLTFPQFLGCLEITKIEMKEELDKLAQTLNKLKG